jgi:hypothetical protein
MTSIRTACPLQAGEMRALQWTDVNLEKRQLRVERNDWQGHITTTKGDRLRHIPVTTRLAGELRAHRHLRATRVLCRADASGLAESALSEAVRSAAPWRTCGSRSRNRSESTRRVSLITTKGRTGGRERGALEQPKCLDGLQVAIERYRVLRTQRTIDAAYERIAEVRFRGAEVAQRLPSFV